MNESIFIKYTTISSTRTRNQPGAADVGIIPKETYTTSLQNQRTYINMKKFKVYRTEKGNLTFKETAEHAYTIHAAGKSSAKEALSQLKRDDKKFREDNV